MARFTPLAALVVVLTACAVETETAEEVTPEVDEMPAAPAGDPPGAAQPCGRDLVLGEDGEPLQVPVLCDPYSERIPDFTEEELGEDVTQPYEAPYDDPFAF